MKEFKLYIEAKLTSLLSASLKVRPEVPDISQMKRFWVFQLY